MKTSVIEVSGMLSALSARGVNDALALTQADVGFAIGAGTDVAMESADVVLMKSDPYDIVGAIELSRATLRKMHQNLWWAVGYNVIAFPLAAGVLYPFVLSPEVAALSMSGKHPGGGDQCADAEAYQAGRHPSAWRGRQGIEFTITITLGETAYEERPASCFNRIAAQVACAGRDVGF